MANPLTVVEACDEHELLNFPLFPAQRRLLEAVESGPRLSTWALGRRSGKSTMCALLMLHNLLLRPDLDGLVRGAERRYAVAIAPGVRQSRLLVQAALSVVEASPILSGLVERVNEDEIHFRGGKVLAAFACNSRGGRGWPISCLVMDESAFFLSSDQTESSMLAETVFRALVPATSQFGSKATIVVSSTPYGTDGFFHDLYMKAAAGEIDALAFHATSKAMREGDPNDPDGSEWAKVEAEEQARDPIGFPAEYLAEFVGSGGAYFDADQLDDVVEDRHELGPSAGRGWIVGLDPSFARDPSAWCVVGQDRDDPGRLVLGLVERLLPPRASKRERRTREAADATMKQVLDRVAEVALRYDANVLSDQHLPATVTDELRTRGVRDVEIVQWSPQTRTDAFAALRSRISMGRISLYDDGQLVSELRRIRSRYRSGASQVEVPRAGSSHCDEAISLALAIYGHDRHGVSSGRPVAWPRGGEQMMSVGLRERRF